MSEEFKNNHNEENEPVTEPSNTEEAQQPKTTYSWVNPKLRGNADYQQGYSYGSSTSESSGENSYQFHSTVHSEPAQYQSVKKEKSFAKKFGMCAAYAAMFGLVAGGIFCGVSYAGNRALGLSAQKQANLPSTQIEKIGQHYGWGDYDLENQNTVADVADAAMPSLVAVTAMSVQQVESFFGRQQYELPVSGTGVIVGKNEKELLIATNEHVIKNTKELSVSFIDQQTVSAQVKGSDAANDLAIVSVKLSDIPDESFEKLKIATLGNSEDLRQGEQVVAIGNALGYGQSVTSGYVSAFDRSVSTREGEQIDGMIQTDAAINPGNSGGALLNMKGELIGINEAKSAGTEIEGIGYAIPISKAEPILENLMTLTTREKAATGKEAYLGVTLVNVSSTLSQTYGIPMGACLSSVVEDGPAEKAGMIKGDVITKFDGREVTGVESMMSILEYYSAGETVEVIVKRAENGEYKDITVELKLGKKSEAQIEPQPLPQFPNN